MNPLDDEPTQPARLSDAVLDIIRGDVRRAVSTAMSETVSGVVASELDDPSIEAAIRVATLDAVEDLFTPPPEPELRFPTVIAWVNEYLSKIYRRQVTERGAEQTRRWCGEWYKHGEAVDRLTSLWRAWEHLRLDGATGGATWWLTYADPMMARLFDTDGTFKYCSPTQHVDRLFDLPATTLPAAQQDALFPPARE